MVKKKSKILRIGVTGGIGSGKSAVCRMFETLGVTVLYADDIARHIGDSDPRVRKEIQSLLGELAYGPDGLLNREYVASRVFSNKKLQKKLNAILHPRVEAAIERKINELAEHGARIVLVEAALIYEARLDRKLDAVIVVDAEEQTRIDRIIARDKTTESSVRKRINAQWDPERKRDRADYVIRNSGSMEELEQKVKFLYTLFQNL